jgi:hypothetical protein
MAIQQDKSIVKSPLVLGPTIAALKFKFTNAASNAGVTILAGGELINNGGSIVITTNTNACVAKVTLNSNIIDVPWVSTEYRDDSLTGFYTSVGNITNENPNTVGSLLSFNVAYFNAGGATVTTNNINANAVVTMCLLFVQDVGPKPPTPGA